MSRRERSIPVPGRTLSRELLDSVKAHFRHISQLDSFVQEHGKLEEIHTRIATADDVRAVAMKFSKADLNARNRALRAKRRVLRLSDECFFAIYWGISRLFDHYLQPRVSRVLLQPPQKNATFKNGKPGSKDVELGLFLACTDAISDTVRETVEQLTQAVIARRGRKALTPRIRSQLWAESLAVARDLVSRVTISGVRRVCGLSAEIGTVADDATQTAILQEFKDQMINWLDIADRQITLRCMLSAVPVSSVGLEGAKGNIARLLMINLEMKNADLCCLFDSGNERAPRSFPVPPQLRKAGVRLWTEPFRSSELRHLRHEIHLYLAKIRNAAGISRRSKNH